MKILNRRMQANNYHYESLFHGKRYLTINTEQDRDAQQKPIAEAANFCCHQETELRYCHIVLGIDRRPSRAPGCFLQKCTGNSQIEFFSFIQSLPFRRLSALSPLSATVAVSCRKKKTITTRGQHRREIYAIVAH